MLMDVQGPRGLGIGMRVVALGRGARRRGAGEWQERRLVRCGLGIRIAILIAISDTLISTARRHFRLCGASAQRAERRGRHDQWTRLRHDVSGAGGRGRPRAPDSSQLTRGTTGLALRSTRCAVRVTGTQCFACCVMNSGRGYACCLINSQGSSLLLLRPGRQLCWRQLWRQLRRLRRWQWRRPWWRPRRRCRWRWCWRRRWVELSAAPS